MLRAGGLETGEARFWFTVVGMRDDAARIAARTLAAAVLDMQAQPPDLLHAQERPNSIASFCMFVSADDPVILN